MCLSIFLKHCQVEEPKFLTLIVQQWHYELMLEELLIQLNVSSSLLPSCAVLPAPNQ